MQLNYSEHESGVFNMKVARADQYLDSIPSDDLMHQILAAEYDICKVRVLSSSITCFQDLDKMAFPYQCISVLSRNKREITKEDGDYEIPEDTEYELFDGSQSEVLSKLVKDTFGTATGVNYSIPHLDARISKEDELNLSAQYALSFKTETKKAWLLKAEGKYVGFFMGEFHGGGFEGTLYGVSPEYRMKGYGIVIYKLMNKLCYEHGAAYFVNDVQLQNAASQQSTAKGGLIPVGIYFHFSINSFLSASTKPENTLSIDGLSNEKELMLELINEYVRKEVPDNFNMTMVKQKIVTPLSPDGKYTVKILYPIVDDREIFVTIKIYNENNEKMEAFGYCAFQLQDY